MSSDALRCEECGTTTEEVAHSEVLGQALCARCLEDAHALGAWLDRAEGFLRRFVVVTDEQACSVILWTAHTHAILAAVAAAYLSVTSPEKRSGKTRLLKVLRLLVVNPWLTGGTTKAALVRKVDRDHPTLLLDESDAAFNGADDYSEALRGVLNNGFSRGKPYTTCVGNSHEVKDFDVFGPKAVAGIGKLPDTVEDRSIPIALKRRTRSEKVERFRERKAGADGERIAAGLAAALEPLTEELTHAEPELPEELSDRGWDIWEPLLAIADAAGGDWPTRGRKAAERLSGQQDPDEETLGVRLLADLRAVFGTEEKLWTKDILAALNALEEAPWGAWNDGEGMRPLELAKKLRPYEIHSRTVRIEDKTRKGYFRDQLEDAWGRYLGDQEAAEDEETVQYGVPNVTSDTLALQSQKPEVSEASHDPRVTDRKVAANPHSNADVTGVTARTPERKEKRAFWFHRGLREPSGWAGFKLSVLPAARNRCGPWPREGGGQEVTGRPFVISRSALCGDAAKIRLGYRATRAIRRTSAFRPLGVSRLEPPYPLVLHRRARGVGGDSLLILGLPVSHRPHLRLGRQRESRRRRRPAGGLVGGR